MSEKTVNPADLQGYFCESSIKLTPGTMRKCPACGSAHIRIAGDGDSYPFVYCGSCNFGAPTGGMQEAIRTWNTLPRLSEAEVDTALQETCADRTEFDHAIPSATLRSRKPILG